MVNCTFGTFVNQSKVPNHRLRKVASPPRLSAGYINLVTDESFRVLTDTDRQIFTVIYISILVVSIFLNLSAMWTVSRRNYRFFQKTSIIALALSDLVTVISFSTNGLEAFSHPYENWTLGSLFCNLVPLGQSFGVISSSMALLVIAMDRYRSIVQAMNKRWDPRKKFCISGVFVCWIICAGLSIPMFIYYKNDSIYVIFLDEHGHFPIPCIIQTMYMCHAVDDKTPLRNFYIIMMICVFGPLLFVFFWFYYNIAQLIWRHRKPIGDREEPKTEVSVTESSMIKSTESPRIQLQKTIIKNNITNNNKTEQMKKKIRTFKIIIVLITSFIVCRLPFWIFTHLKLTYVMKFPGIWELNYSIVALNIFSTILNPLLYTYLSITVKVVSKITRELNAFLCCFFSDEEFVEFEKGNAVFVNGFNGKPEKNCKLHGRNLYENKLHQGLGKQRKISL